MIKILKVIIIFIVVLSPFMLYVSQFGFALSSNHTRWAEFGSAMSGIYSPIIAFIALLVLVGQTKLLVVQTKSQNAMNKHHYDQTYIQESRKNIDYYIGELEKYLKENINEGCSIKEYLNSSYARLPEKELLENSVKNLSQNFHESHGRVFDTWIAVYPILVGLNSQKEFPYKHSFTSSLQRIITVLSLETCTAIDNFYFCQSNDLQKGKYFFNKKLGENNQQVKDND